MPLPASAATPLPVPAGSATGATAASGGAAVAVPVLLVALQLVAEAHDEHLRAAAARFIWLPEKQAAALSSPQHAQSMVPALNEPRVEPIQLYCLVHPVCLIDRMR